MDTLSISFHKVEVRYYILSYDENVEKKNLRRTKRMVIRFLYGVNKLSDRFLIVDNRYL